MTTKLVVRDGHLAGIPARRVDVCCEHGTSRAFVVPSRDVARNVAALEILRVRHQDRLGCACRDIDVDPPRRP